MNKGRSFEISKHLVLKAFLLVKANKGAAGVDNESEYTGGKKYLTAEVEHFDRWS